MAMDFLIIYGWVILIVLVVLGTTTYFRILGQSLFFPEKCIIDATSGLHCEDFTADDINDITLRIKNIMETDVTISRINITTGLKDLGKTHCSNSYGGTIPGYSSNIFIISENCDLQAGDKVKGEITISYQRGILNKIATGTFSSYVNSVGG